MDISNFLHYISTWNSDPTTLSLQNLHSLESLGIHFVFKYSMGKLCVDIWIEVIRFRILTLHSCSIVLVKISIVLSDNIILLRARFILQPLLQSLGGHDKHNCNYAYHSNTEGSFCLILTIIYLNYHKCEEYKFSCTDKKVWNEH